jgi:hypothetical protein
MKSLLDVNARSSMRWLLASALILLVGNVDLRTKDEQVLQMGENDLITTDQDFEEMIWKEISRCFAP